MFELNFVKPSYGDCLWQYENNKPDYGINVCFIDFGNPKVLGHSFSMAPWIEIPLGAKEKASRLVMRVSWGLAYITKKFDIDYNHKNIAIGSHWNAFVQYRWFWHLKLNERIRLEPGLTLTHVSNGRAQVPNLGLNLISANLGVNFKLPQSKCENPKMDSSTMVPSRHELNFIYGYGINEKDPPGSRKYNAHTFSLLYYFNKRNTHKFGLGADVFYEEIYRRDLRDYHIPLTGTIDETIRIGTKVSYAYTVGRISFPIEMGVYVMSKLNADGALFHRFGIRYTGGKGLIAHVSLKTHWAIAHHFELGVGYRLPLKKKEN
jgi:hypothetical protein